MRFRWFIILLVSLATAVTLAVSGTAIFWLRQTELNRELSAAADKAVTRLAERTEGLLASVEQSLVTLAHARVLMNDDYFSTLLLGSMVSQPLIRTLYFLDRDGRTSAIWTREALDPRSPDYVGIDFSYTPLYRSLKSRTDPVWSDKFVSTLSGSTFIGVGLRVGENAAIAEIDLKTLLATVKTASAADARIWVTDRLGEVLVDTEQRQAGGVLNIRGEPAVNLALAGRSLPETMRLQGTRYHPAAARSEKLGWLFLVGIPSGLDNPEVRTTLTDILLLAISFFLAALLLSPLWSQIIASQLESLRHLADRVADGEDPPTNGRGIIREFNDLGGNLRDMAGRIRERESALRELNQELEQRVAARTAELEKTNQDLRTSLDNNTRMRDLLVNTEKQAALGRLVAGVAHEMNTPIGNAVMAITTLKENQRDLEAAMKDGLRKSDLDRFLDQSAQGLDIAERNIDRAAELVTSFKHVARDQTSSVRRKFDLSEMVHEVLLTLHPMLKRSPHKVEVDIEEGLDFNSYPGVIGQILTNLITNALMHAWEDGRAGTLAITARRVDGGQVRISVADNGRGIPETLRKKVFEPFFTTRMGRGGTGLGLNIAHNGASNVLGGGLDFESRSGGGTVFHLDIPRVAPVLQGESDHDSGDAA